MIVVLMDRDGVVNVNREDYVKTPDELAVIPEALEALALLKSAGVRCIIVSNQAGVGRGLISPAELDRITAKLKREVSEHGGEISAIYYCTHRKDEGCDCRKPKPGLFRQASADHGFRLNETFFIGDSQSDIEAGHLAGCRTILVLSGKATLEQIEKWSFQPERVETDMLTAVKWLLSVLGDGQHKCLEDE